MTSVPAVFGGNRGTVSPNLSATRTGRQLRTQHGAEFASPLKREACSIRKLRTVIITRLCLLAALVLLAAAPARADALPSRAELAAQAARRFPQMVRVGDLLHRAVLKPVESQDVVGHVERVVRGPEGEVRRVIS